MLAPFSLFCLLAAHVGPEASSPKVEPVGPRGGRLRGGPQGAHHARQCGPSRAAGRRRVLKDVQLVPEAAGEAARGLAATAPAEEGLGPVEGDGAGGGVAGAGPKGDALRRAAARPAGRNMHGEGGGRPQRSARAAGRGGAGGAAGVLASESWNNHCPG